MSADPNQIHNVLLRPAILQILRAAGFHAARPSVIDTLADLTARYILLLASRTAAHAHSRHNSPVPDVPDVRLALSDCGAFAPSLTAAEEAWKEALRTPLGDVPERNGLRMRERADRDAEDTRDVREFLEWFSGPGYREIQRVAGLVPEEGQVAEVEAMMVEREDYLTALKKKHSKTGEESRFQGSVLGKPADDKVVKIEGGPESLQEWKEMLRQQTAVTSGAKTTNGTLMEISHDDNGAFAER